jgi:hypothetical protein
VANNVSWKLADSFGGEDARDARQVHRDRNVGPGRLRFKNSAHVFRGIVPEFKNQYAAVAKQVARLVNQALVHFDTRRSSEQSGVRFVVAHFALQFVGVIARDVGRIAND